MRTLMAWVVAASVVAGTAHAVEQQTEFDKRARETERQMTDDERFSMLISIMGRSGSVAKRDKRIPLTVPMSSGYTPGVPRLGVPALLMSGGGLGITNPGSLPGSSATALPAGVALAASFNPRLAREAGAMIGREARARGFNVVLGGAINLARDPRNGRNFEYLSEDPLVNATIGAEAINGTQGERVISTIKHYVFNDNETNRHWLDAIIEPGANRESDLLAFQIAIERSQPGAVMCAYNKINGVYACGDNDLLNDLLKKTWGYRGWVMSDWGAVHSEDYALNGLDQESGVPLDVGMNGGEWFVTPLRKAYADGKLPKERLSDMVRRILRSIYAAGIDKWGPPPKIDMAKDNEVALEVARQGIVLLKNDGVLPLDAGKVMRIAVIGGHAQDGVPMGLGSSTVIPPGRYAAVVKVGDPEVRRNLYLLHSSPIAELKKLLPKAQIEFDAGQSAVEAALLARRSDLVIVFGISIEGEGFDLPDLTLPWGQDAVIDAVANANSNTIVLLETGNPVAMPWRDKVKGIVEAWYPGQAGGQAIAEVLTGKVSPSGRLPITFPADLAQTPRPKLPGLGMPWGTPTRIDYNEGAEVGYRWYAKTDAMPLFPFGYGLGYTSFALDGLTVSGGDTITATFTVTNTGNRDGADVPQLYLTDAPREKRMRLLAFERIELRPGEKREVTLKAEPRLLAHFDASAEQWRIAAGSYRVAVGESAADLKLTADVPLQERLFGR